MQRKKLRFLVTILLGCIITSIHAMNPGFSYPESPEASSSSGEEYPYANRPERPKYEEEHHYANRPEQPEEEYPYANAPEKTSDSNPSTPPEEEEGGQYAMASEVRHIGSDPSQPYGKIPYTPPSTPHDETKDSSSGKARNLKRLSSSFQSLRKGIARKGSSSSSIKVRRHTVRMMEGGLMANPEHYSHREKEPIEEYTYGNTPGTFNKQLSDLLHEEDPSIPEAMRLIMAGADPNTLGKGGNTILHRLTAQGNTGSLEYLLNNTTINPNSVNEDGKTALHIAFSQELFDAMILLVPHTATRPTGLTLNFALRKNIDLAKAIIQADPAQANSTNEKGQSPLHFVNFLPLKKKEITMITKLLLNKGANPNAKDTNGKKPIHYAIATQHIAVTKRLLPKTTDIDLIQLAAKTTNEKIKNLLLHAREEKTTT